MKSIPKLIFVLGIFSAIFFALRVYGKYIGYDIDTLVSDLGGLTYLYSTIGTIFAIFAAFVMISESEDWNSLVNAQKNEIRELNELLLWSKGLPLEIEDKLHNLVKQYLRQVVDDEWNKLSHGKENFQTEKTIDELHDVLSQISKENKEISSRLFSTFDKILEHRITRIEYSYEPMPKILKMTVFLVATFLIVLSLFIGVHNIWLDYIFMFCIVTLTSVILLVIDDLDNPLRPGDWYLTTDNYLRLFNKLKSRN